MNAAGEIEVSVVLPCLNEAETLPVCIEQARTALAGLGVPHEIILADNGSVDGSQMVARRMGARVVHVQSKGYGFAVMAGVEASRGRFIVLADADNRYDLSDIGRFLAPLRAGHDLVQGCRLSAGGGRIEPGAMVWVNRILAIPLFSWLARRWFGARVRDVFCGLRAFSRSAYDRWALRCIGLEFATEMIIKASLFHDRIAEIPVAYRPDPRSIRRPHLKNIRDGWRTFRLFLISCPRWLFLAPGGLAILLGLAGYYLGYANARLFSVRFDVHTILLSSLVIILGYQAVLFAGFTILFALNERFLPPSPRVKWWVQRINMERGLVLGILVFAAGLGFLLSAVLLWRENQYGAMDYQAAMRRVIPGVTMTAIGFQTVLSGAFMSILGMYRRPAQIQAPPPPAAPTPWLSVVMPTYQGGHHLDSALSSVAMQNDGGIEVILVDDGSTDYIRDVVKAWEGTLAMRVVWRERVGNWAVNTNLAMAEARGEWVCMLHQDDMWIQGRIAQMRDLMRRFPEAGLLAHPVYFIDGKGWKIGRWRCPLPSNRALPPDFVLPRLAAQDFFAIMAPMFRRGLLDLTGPLDEDLWYHADWDFWLKLAAVTPTVCHPEPLAAFRVHALSQTAQRTRDLGEIGRQIDVVIGRALAHPAFPASKAALVRRTAAFHRALYLCMLGAVHGADGRAWRVVREAIRLGPIRVCRYLHLSRFFDRLWPRLRMVRRRA